MSRETQPPHELRFHSPRSADRALDPVCPPVRPSIPFAGLWQILVSENENRRYSSLIYIRSEPPTSRGISKFIVTLSRQRRDIPGDSARAAPGSVLRRLRQVCGKIATSQARPTGTGVRDGRPAHERGPSTASKGPSCNLETVIDWPSPRAGCTGNPCPVRTRHMNPSCLWSS